jgi:hypothetical protein
MVKNLLDSATGVFKIIKGDGQKKESESQLIIVLNETEKGKIVEFIEEKMEEYRDRLSYGLEKFDQKTLNGMHYRILIWKILKMSGAISAPHVAPLVMQQCQRDSVAFEYPNFVEQCRLMKGYAWYGAAYRAG